MNKLLNHPDSAASPWPAWLQPLSAVAALVAGADEIHQIWLPGRKAGWDDWCADMAGAALGLLWLRRGWR